MVRSGSWQRGWVNRSIPYNVYAYCLAQTIVNVLKQAGDDFTRENVMRQAQSLNSLGLPMLLPGIRIDTGPRDCQPIEQLQLQRFDGTRWALFGDVLDNQRAAE